MSKLYGTGSSNIGIPSPNVSVAKTTQTSDYEGDGELTPGGSKSAFSPNNQRISHLLSVMIPAPDMIVVKGRRPTKPEEDYEGSDYDYVPSSLGSYATVERLSPEGRGTDYSEAAMKSQRRKENIVEKSRKSGGLKKAAEDRDGKGKGAA